MDDDSMEKVLALAHNNDNAMVEDMLDVVHDDNGGGNVHADGVVMQ
jgi:hypothetical protein